MFQSVSKLNRQFQIISNWPHGFKTVWLFPDSSDGLKTDFKTVWTFPDDFKTFFTASELPKNLEIWRIRKPMQPVQCAYQDMQSDRSKMPKNIAIFMFYLATYSGITITLDSHIHCVSSSARWQRRVQYGRSKCPGGLPVTTSWMRACLHHH